MNTAARGHDGPTPQPPKAGLQPAAEGRALSVRRAGGREGFLGRHWRRIAAILFSVAITAGIVACRDQIARLSGYGYLGVFLISLLGNATVILPVPSLAVVFAGGGVLRPAVVGLVAGVGEPLGELTGYLAGYGGSVVLEDTPHYRRLRGWMEHRGMLTIFVLSAIPNPLFDLAGITAGALHMPVAKFLLACWLGKTLKAVAIAYLGSVSLGLFESGLRSLGL